MRYEHSGDERISGFMPAGRSRNSSKERNAHQKQQELRASIQEPEDSVAYIDWKQNFYDEVLSGKRPYVSNLIRTEA